MSPLDYVWAVILGSGLLYELYTLVSATDGDTLSERLRVWFGTKTRLGRNVFVVAWLLFTAWFLPHIVLGGFIPGVW